MAKYSKEEVAFIQLITAIELFNQNNFISAITLGSIAEELFSAFLSHHAKENNLNILNRAEIDQVMFDLTKDLLGIDNYISYRNRPRNELKHHGQENNKNFVSGNFKNIALMHISGAISNYKLRTNELPRHKEIIRFCEKQGIS